MRIASGLADPKTLGGSKTPEVSQAVVDRNLRDSKKGSCFPSVLSLALNSFVVFAF